MTDTPTAPDNKPSNLRDILVYMAGQIAEDVRANHASYDWKSSRVDEAVAAIEQYGREQRLLGRKDVTLCLEDTYNEVEADTSDYFSDEFKHGYKSAVHDSRIDNEKYIAELQAIDTTLRNFSGQTEGEGE